MDYKHSGVAKFASESESLTKGPVQPALYQNLERHPTEKMGAAAMESQERRDLQQMSVMYGSHMPMRAVIERNILAQVSRPGGHGSNMFGLNHSLGKYDELDFADILNDPRESPALDREGFHTRMEKVYGL